jgi:hypothetical protein
LDKELLELFVKFEELLLLSLKELLLLDVEFVLFENEALLLLAGIEELLELADILFDGDDELELFGVTVMFL